MGEKKNPLPPLIIQKLDMYEFTFTAKTLQAFPFIYMYFVVGRRGISF